MIDVLEVVGVLAVAALMAFLVQRFFPDSREAMGEELDDALFQGGVRGLWMFIALVVLGLLIYWLLR